MLYIAAWTEAPGQREPEFFFLFSSFFRISYCLRLRSVLMFLLYGVLMVLMVLMVC